LPSAPRGIVPRWERRDDGGRTLPELRYALTDEILTDFPYGCRPHESAQGFGQNTNEIRDSTPKSLNSDFSRASTRFAHDPSRRLFLLKMLCGSRANGEYGTRSMTQHVLGDAGLLERENVVHDDRVRLDAG
jgi:hypothetical protein